MSLHSQWAPTRLRGASEREAARQLQLAGEPPDERPQSQRAEQHEDREGPLGELEHVPGVAARVLPGVHHGERVVEDREAEERAERAERAAAFAAEGQASPKSARPR